VIVATVATVALAAVLFSASSLYDVVDKGKGPPIVPYEGGGVVYKVRVLDLFNVYADEESRPAPDKLSSVGLVAAASMSLMTLLLLTAAGAGARRRRFYAFATAGLALLAADELFAFHETLGHNLRFLADLPGVERPDDLIFAGYLIPLAIFAWSFRDLLRAQRKAVQLFAVGTCFFAISVAADLAGVSLDEPAEGVAAICLLAGLVILTAATLREELALSGSESSTVSPSAEQTYRPPVLTQAGFDRLAELTAARQRSRRTGSAGALASSSDLVRPRRRC
jgi:hypothetical protein